MGRKLLVAGNWKMNTDAASGVQLADAVAESAATAAAVDVLVCPPFPYLAAVSSALQGKAVAVGAQNCYSEPSGAFTGEVSVSMLRDIGCTHVILGHSERRHVMGETDAQINAKTKASLEGGLVVVLCVGELLSEREAGETEAVLDRQMAGGLDGISESDLARVVIAYEPVWAIGTGKTATPDQAETAHAHLRSWVAQRYSAAAAEQIRILYGGSVKPDNAETLLSQGNVDGALVGGASLKADLFGPIINAAQKISG